METETKIKTETETETEFLVHLQPESIACNRQIMSNLIFVFELVAPSFKFQMYTYLLDLNPCQILSKIHDPKIQKSKNP